MNDHLHGIYVIFYSMSLSSLLAVFMFKISKGDEGGKCRMKKRSWRRWRRMERKKNDTEDDVEEEEEE